MEYEAFKKELQKVLKERLDGDIVLEYGMVPQNNRPPFEGLHILSPKDEIMPVFDVEDYYRMYFEEERDFHGIVGEILEKIKNPDIRQKHMTCRVEMLDEVRENIYFALVNYEKNRESLKEVPYKRFLDLAIVLYVCMKPEGESYLCMMITSPLMKLWGMDFGTLYEAARKNAVEKMPAEILELKDIFRMMMEEKLKQSMQNVEMIKDGQIGEAASIVAEAMMGLDITRKKVFFMSNSARLFGAACILYPGVLQKLAEEVQADLYIAPVSVHEVMIFPDLDMNVQWLKERAAFASGECESEKEWLSNELYKYDLETGEISIFE